MIERMSGPGRISASGLAREVGVSQPTLSRWLKQAGTVGGTMTDATPPPSPSRRPDDWTPQEKLAAVVEAAALAEHELGEWLRRRGLTTKHLEEWRETALEAFSPRTRAATKVERARVKELERELRRKDKALAETAALLVLQGKVQALWAAEDAPTRPQSDARSSTTSRSRKRRGRE
jgi:DNA-binding transcriptional ArsR family regulator